MFASYLFEVRTIYRFPLKTNVTLSPLALLLLAACGGGGGGPVSFTRDGKVIKGPLEGAKAFLDYDGDGEYDSNEPMVRTGSDGSYTLTGSSTYSNATLVAIASARSNLIEGSRL